MCSKRSCKIITINAYLLDSTWWFIFKQPDHHYLFIYDIYSSATWSYLENLFGSVWITSVGFGNGTPGRISLWCLAHFLGGRPMSQTASHRTAWLGLQAALTVWCKTILILNLLYRSHKIFHAIILSANATVNSVTLPWYDEGCAVAEKYLPICQTNAIASG